MGPTQVVVPVFGALAAIMFNKFLNLLQGSVKLKSQPVFVWPSG